MPEPMRRALLSVSDKSGLVDFARGLHLRGFELVSTGGTATALAAAGLPVTNVSDVTAFPEMMDGRVKTLHPKIHGGILARRHEAHDLEAARAHDIGLIDVVAVNLYPFARTAADPAAGFDTLIENIDIGGPSMVRAAAKNFRDVVVVVDPADYAEVLAALDAGGPAPAQRFDLARRALAHTAQYDTTITEVLETIRFDESGPVREPAALAPSRLVVSASKVRDLRYGENPHQTASWYALGDAGLGRPSILQGKELSYTNLLDLDAAARIALEFDMPAAVVIKHTNPCGVAIGDSAAEAYHRAREADPLSAFGGIVGLNRPVDAATAAALTSTFIEAVVAPAVLDEARPVLAAKPNLRVVVADTAPFADPASPVIAREVRSIIGGLLVQARDLVSEAREPWPSDAVRVVTRRAPTPAEWEALRFAWRVCAHVKSNTVLFADRDRTRAIGAGQMSRVDAVKVATMKAAGWQPAERPLAGTVAASDAFFPFRDGLDAVAAAGATAVVHPGGSMRDAEVIAAADEHDLAMVLTGRRHFRH
ncbi:MAG: bifunctional phosphoribosylaminoimidazolecarboxamide formyltransferase/IMP cyclohydrolase [Vicinamibacterales bacterium]